MKTDKVASIPLHHVKKETPQSVVVRKDTDFNKTLKVIFPPKAPIVSDEMLMKAIRSAR